MNQGISSPGSDANLPESPGPSANPDRQHAEHCGDDYAPGIEIAFPREFQEGDRVVECVQGEVPDFVRGTYYLNGPARFGIGDLAYGHWLDGDGMVCALHFGTGGLGFTNRYVDSTKFTAEKLEGRPIFRTFGTSFPGSRLNRAGNALESPVNVSVYPVGGHLLAFGEQGLPWALDPRTLETRGQFTFQGRLNDASPFSAHPKLDLESNELFNFGVFFSATSPRLYFYRFLNGTLQSRTSLPLQYPCSVHDFALSKHYAIFYLSPYLLDIQGLRHDGRTVMESLQWMPEYGSRLMILDRTTGGLTASAPLGQSYCLHLMNAFEQDGLLVVDLLELEAPVYNEYQPIHGMFHNVAKGKPVRLNIDLRRAEVAERATLPYRWSPDFPAVDARLATKSAQDFWMLGISTSGKPGRKFFDQLVHGNWDQRSIDVYQSPARRYLCSEPVFIGAPQSHHGVVLCQEVDVAERASYFLLFSAHDVKSGPIARIAVGQQICLGFHATFCSDAAASDAQ